MATKKQHDERIYTVNEIAALWGIYRKTVVKLFRNEPGVMAIPRLRSDGKGDVGVSLRIPASVFERVREQLTNK